MMWLLINPPPLPNTLECMQFRRGKRASALRGSQFFAGRPVNCCNQQACSPPPFLCPHFILSWRCGWRFWRRGGWVGGGAGGASSGTLPASCRPAAGPLKDRTRPAPGPLLIHLQSAAGPLPARSWQRPPRHPPARCRPTAGALLARPQPAGRPAPGPLPACCRSPRLHRARLGARPAPSSCGTARPGRQRASV